MRLGYNTNGLQNHRLSDALRLLADEGFRGAEEAAPPLRIMTLRDNRKKYFRPYKEQRGDVNVVVRQGSWKGIWNVGRDTFELYDLKTDRGEERDLADSEPERAAALQAVALARRERDAMRRSARTDGAPVEMTDDEREKLRALGYLGEDE